MHLYVVGLNHKTAPIEVREKFAVPDHSLPEALQRAREIASETVLISTCNRTECYAVAPVGALPLVQNRLFRSEQEHHLLHRHLYYDQDADAARRLFRVACGLDSMVLGEPQILGQVRQAFLASKAAGAVGSVLDPLFRRAIETGRRARAETEIGSGGFSIGHAAVDLARSIFGDLRNSSMMVLGAGKISELTARHLRQAGAGIVMVANRTFTRAEELAARLGGTAVHFSQFADHLVKTDVVITGTAAPHPIVHFDTVQAALRKRRGRPLFFIDLAVPRDVEPQVAQLENAFVYTVDDLQAVLGEMVRGRSAAAHQVERIIEEEVREFVQSWRLRDAAPVLAELNRRSQLHRAEELERLRRQHPDLPESAWVSIEAALKSLSTKLTRDPIRALRSAAQEPGCSESDALLDAARRLFRIEITDSTDRQIEDAK